MEELLVEDHSAVRLLTMNRPLKHNALNTGLTRALLDALLSAQEKESCRAIVLAGAGKSFCAGADVGEFAALSGDDARAARERADLTAALHRVFSKISKPIISAVHGNALGGGAGLALACDLMVVADDMRFGYPELSHGIVAAIVMANLVRQVGQKTAFCMVSTGRVLNGADAVGLGIAMSSEPAGHVLDRAMGVASALAACHPDAMEATKNLFYRVSSLPFDEALTVGRDTNVIMRSFRKTESR
ncbi:enoyl-CoA hydratase/isomerase family protein [Paraburkholderia dilworthii]|uniref:Enoyl-CoA hydratase/isomerase family protein n=1 Tax=Paraburkholderia dilworthii TaxID=948106 RepID=A0ABW9D4S5_9BURK